MCIMCLSLSSLHEVTLQSEAPRCPDCYYHDGEEGVLAYQILHDQQFHTKNLSLISFCPKMLFGVGREEAMNSKEESRL